MLYYDDIRAYDPVLCFISSNSQFPMLTEIHYHFHHKFRGNFTTIIINLQNDLKQECIPVGCVPPARWPHPVVSNGGSAQLPPPHASTDADPPGCRPTWMQMPSWMQTPPWTEGMTHACENTTLPQTSFAGGKNSAQWEAGEIFFKCQKTRYAFS